MSEEEEIKVVKVEKLSERDRPETYIVAFCSEEDCFVDECGCEGGD